MERRAHESVSELQRQERYTPEEVAEVLGIGLNVVRHAAFAGEPRADRRPQHHQRPPGRRPWRGLASATGWIATVWRTLGSDRVARENAWDV